MGNNQKKAAKKKPELTEDDLQFLLSNTFFNRKEIEEWHTRFMNDCPSGKLDKKQFIQVYRRFYPQGDPDAFCEHVFRVFDQNKNGLIDFNEFLLAISVTSKNSDLELKLQWVFKIYDIDGNGQIEKSELKTIVDSIYRLLSNGKDESTLKKVAREHADEIFKKFDIDNNKYISLEEFITGCMRDQNLLKLLAPSA